MLRGLAAVAAAGMMLVMADSAAAGNWVPQNVPAKQGASGRSAAVSCLGSAACMAVGASMNSTGKQRALAQVWDGSVWKATAVPVPYRATNTRLAGVSCTAASACTAVGSYGLPPGPDGGARDQYPLVVRWDGTAWTRQVVPRPSGTSKSYLNGVSCTATGGCKAVGGYRNGSVKSGTLAEHWDGQTWKVVATPNPPGATFSGLNGISCVGPSCMAVGGSTPAGGGLPTQPISMRFNGTAWVMKPVATPAGSAISGLNGVSCTGTALACTAVGGSSSEQIDFDKPLVMRWNGTGWAEQATPTKPYSVLRRQFTAVSCTSATKCTAVGPEMDSAPGGGPLVERWDGSSWAVQPAPMPTGRETAWFTGVSCTTGGCTAVGAASVTGDAGEEGTTLAERQTASGTDWAVQSTPSGSGALRTDLFDVSCSTPTSCVGVGVYYNAAGPGAAAAHWNGTSWTQKPTGAALAAGRHGDALVGVSCTSATACMAVGSFQEPHPTYGAPYYVQRPEARRWNGTAWTAKKMAVPADATWHTTVNSVACSSATSCVAVGTYENASNVYKPFIEHWNGTSWILKPVPLPSGATRSELNSVACTAPDACIAVGDFGTDPSHPANTPLAMRWNGSAWAVQTVPAPAGTMYARLTGVSCAATTPGPCTAVGSFSTTSAYYGSSSLTERWSGTTWALQDAGYGTPTDVSCPTLTSCTSVDAAGGAAKGWDGSNWSNKGSMAFYPYGVSCTSAPDCTAVGTTLRLEMIARVYFAGLVLVNGGSAPAAARYSEQATAMAAPAQSAGRTLTKVAPAAPGSSTRIQPNWSSSARATAARATGSRRARRFAAPRPELDSNQRPTP